MLPRKEKCARPPHVAVSAHHDHGFRRNDNVKPLVFVRPVIGLRTEYQPVGTPAKKHSRHGEIQNNDAGDECPQDFFEPWKNPPPIPAVIAHGSLHSSASGNLNRTSSPPPSPLRARISPPCAFATRCAMARPRP